MQLNDLKPGVGANKNTKRVGRGTGSGLGTTSGRGSKGQKSRAGHNIPRGFEGGQMPLSRRLPKRGFSNARFSKNYEIVNIRDIEIKFQDGETVSKETLREKGLAKGNLHGIKVLGVGSLSKKLTVQVDKVSKGAREIIEKAGGSISE